MFGNFTQDILYAYMYTAYTVPWRLFGDLQMNDLAYDPE